jgi:hypothetical protein
MIQRRIAPLGAASRLALISAPMFAGCLLVPSSGTAQEALRTAVEGDRSYQNRRQQAIESPMPMFWGPVGFSVGTGVGLTYDDNVLLQETNAQEDFIIAPGVNLGINYPITERSRLNFGVGVAYEIYTQKSREDRFTLAPNSELALDFEVGRSLITTYDRFSYSQDLLKQGDVANTGSYGGFNNTLGFRVFWAPEPLLVEGGYSWNIFISDKEQYGDLDRSSHQVFFRLGQIIEERTRWGIEVSGSQTMYDTGVRNDFTSLSVGPYLEWQVTDALNLSLRGGWTWSIFDDNGLTPAPDDVSVPYAALQARHQLTASFSHNLSAVREVSVGTETQYLETLVFRYGFNWQIGDNIAPTAGIFYEKGKAPTFLVDEEYDRVGIDFGLPFRLTDHLTLSLGYQFTVRDSNAPNRGYDSNRATLNLAYQF